MLVLTAATSPCFIRCVMYDETYEESPNLLGDLHFLRIQECLASTCEFRRHNKSERQAGWFCHRVMAWRLGMFFSCLVATCQEFMSKRLLELVEFNSSGWISEVFRSGQSVWFPARIAPCSTRWGAFESPATLSSRLQGWGWSVVALWTVPTFKLISPAFEAPDGGSIEPGCSCCCWDLADVPTTARDQRCT